MVSAFFELDLIYRVILAFASSFILSILFGDKLICFLKKKQKKGQPIRADGPQSHVISKQGTPTMGGLLIIGTTVFSTLCFAKLTNPFIWIALATFIIYAIMGFIDDYIKVTKQTSNAMKARTKLSVQFLASFFAIAAITFYTKEDGRYELNIPYLRDVSINLFYFYIPFAMVVVAGSSNAINLTDGLDGLVSGLLIFVLLVFLYISYNVVDTSSIAYGKEISILCASLIGSLLGFLWFNFYPAQMFMGDTASLALGALIGIISIMLKQEILFAIIGLVFVMEAVSVMLQVGSYKLRGKRIFKMAPIHHHFEQLGLSETKVVIRFWIVGIMLMLIGFMAV